jgi:hypothetical protein
LSQSKPSGTASGSSATARAMSSSVIALKRAQSVSPLRRRASSAVTRVMFSLFVRIAAAFPSTRVEVHAISKTGRPALARTSDPFLKQRMEPVLKDIDPLAHNRDLERAIEQIARMDRRAQDAETRKRTREGCLGRAGAEARASRPRHRRRRYALAAGDGRRGEGGGRYRRQQPQRMGARIWPA